MLNSDIFTFIFWFIFTLLWSGLGTTLYYHRFGAHKSFSSPRWLVYLMLFGGYLSMMGSPLAWISTHRFHHMVTDSQKDPHSPTRGTWYAFNGWLWDKDTSIPYLVDDLAEKYPLLKFFGNESSLPARKELNFAVVIGFRLIVWYFFGLYAFLASSIGGLIIFILPQLINTLCHMPKLGYRNHETKDLSTNIRWLAYLTFGEAWHNNHHAKPRRLKQGEEGEFDISYAVCRLLKKMGLLWDEKY